MKYVIWSDGKVIASFRFVYDRDRCFEMMVEGGTCRCFEKGEL